MKPEPIEAQIVKYSIPNLLRVAKNPAICILQRDAAVTALEKLQADERVAMFFAHRAERERLYQLRQRALNLKNRPIK